MNNLILADFDPLRDFAWLGLGSLALLFGISFVVAVVFGDRVNQSDFQFVLAQIICIPIAVYMTLWCYQHPERFENNPNGWMQDVRIVGPIFLLFDAVVFFQFLCRPRNVNDEAIRLMKQAAVLRDQGKVEEAEALFTKAIRMRAACK